MANTVAKYQKYAEYQDSGIEWLCEIPSHWFLKKHKYIAEFSKGKNPELLFDNYSDGLYPYLSMDSLRGKADSKYAEYKKGLVLVQDNQPLIIWDGSNSGEFVLGRKGLLSSTMASACLIYEIQDKYYWYLCVCIEPEMRKHATGMGIPHVNGEELRGIVLPLPELNEQTQIANFLDYETAKIDHLIEKQQQLIELLKEKRQAVISHAVTKGLDPNVPMKDSGMKWLGEVPKHWSVSLIKYQCREITDGAHISPELENGEHLFISIRDIKEGVINFEDTLLTSEKSYQYLVHTGCKPFAGDILFSKDGTIGQTAITPSNINFVVASSLIIIRPNYFKVISEFLDLLLRSDVVQEQVESFVKGAALRRLSIQNLLKIWGVFPPIDEQEKIVEFVLFQLDKYKVLEDKAEKQVELLKERRTALISAAVTGKIDVRNWQAPTVAEADTEFSA
ncbi:MULTISPECIES: restriction endonuclease subunit S [Acinetobacter]|jgi:type I restriction enzyme S subunit|uniref:restriction endonuclease subunit S n=1 Tax=Acinetobacter TaxID=469 RepID=UPI000C553113|nr:MULTISPECIES: restriction endonuclease subunit S [unclassified Acinetobacter]MBC68956.1 restriction endonuclease subunit S [Acinetobacter sp.]MBT49722.1 restriction endonuclease subunit S [Acinetobacter sp.]